MVSIFNLNSSDVINTLVYLRLSLSNGIGGDGVGIVVTKLSHSETIFIESGIEALALEKRINSGVVIHDADITRQFRIQISAHAFIVEFSNDLEHFGEFISFLSLVSVVDVINANLTSDNLTIENEDRRSLSFDGRSDSPSEERSDFIKSSLESHPKRVSLGEGIVDKSNNIF